MSELERLFKMLRDGIIFARMDGGSKPCRAWADAADRYMSEKLGPGWKSDYSPQAMEARGDE
jgi:hypothetical protein